MRTYKKIEFLTEDNNVSVQNVETDDGFVGIKMNIGGYEYSDGESITFSFEEFAEFVTQCSVTINEIMKYYKDGE